MQSGQQLPISLCSALADQESPAPVAGRELGGLGWLHIPAPSPHPCQRRDSSNAEKAASFEGWSLVAWGCWSMLCGEGGGTTSLPLPSNSPSLRSHIFKCLAEQMSLGGRPEGDQIWTGGWEVNSKQRKVTVNLCPGQMKVAWHRRLQVLAVLCVRAIQELLFLSSCYTSLRSSEMKKAST